MGSFGGLIVGSRFVPDRNKVFFGIPNVDANVEVDYARDDAIKDLELKNQQLQDQISTITTTIQPPTVTISAGSIGVILPVTGLPFDGLVGDTFTATAATSPSGAASSITNRVLHMAMDVSGVVGLGEYFAVGHRTSAVASLAFVAKSAATGFAYSIPNPAGVTGTWKTPHYIDGLGNMFKGPPTAGTTMPIYKNSGGWLANTQTFTIGAGSAFMVTVKFLASITDAEKTSGIVTLTTSVAHTYRAGDGIVVSGLGGNYNGSFAIIDTPTSTTFRYALAGLDVAAAVVSGAAYTFRQSALVRNNAGGEARLIDPNDARDIGTIAYPSGATTIRGGGTHLWTNVGHYSEAVFEYGTGITWTRPYVLTFSDTIFLSNSAFVSPGGPSNFITIQGNGSLVFLSTRTVSGVTTWGMTRFSPTGSAAEVNNTLFSLTGLAVDGEPFGIGASLENRQLGIVQVSGGFDTFAVAGSYGSLYYGGITSGSPGAAIWVLDGAGTVVNIYQATLAERDITNATTSVVFSGVQNSIEGGQLSNDFVWVAGGHRVFGSAPKAWSLVGYVDL